jgi:hypothetical protein
MLLIVPFSEARAQGQAVLGISPTSVVFPKTRMGAEVHADIVLTNSTESTVMLQQIIVSGIDFAETHDCGKQLAAESKCSVHLTFKPATSGERIGNLEIVSSDSGLPHFVGLTGIGE